jgi:hypothetical protein
MTGLVLVALVAGALTTVGVWWSARRTETLVAVGLRFPREVRPEQVEALLGSLSGLSRHSRVVLETFASELGIRHALRADQATLDIVSGQLRVLLPGIRIEPGFAHPPVAWRSRSRLVWSVRQPLLRTDRTAEAAAGLLASLTPLARNEALLIQIELRPGRPLALPSETANGESLRSVRTKQAGPLLESRFSVAVACCHPGRATHLLARVSASYRARRGSRGLLRVRRSLSGPGRLLTARGQLFSPGELAALIGWPIGAPMLPGLEQGTAPMLLPDRRIPSQGVLLGLSTWPGLEQHRLAQPIAGATSHSLIAGPTGSGKSALLLNLVLQHLHAGRGCLVIDGKGDLAHDLLARIPADRVDAVVVLDPASGGPVPGLRVFGAGRDPELTADLVLGVLKELFSDSWGVRSEQWLRAGLVTLAHDPTATLGDLPYLFSDDGYRRQLVGRLQDPLLLATWASFEAMKPGERANQLGAPLNKLHQLLGRRVLRTVLSQPQPTLDLTRIIRQGHIVIVSLAPGRIGGPAARLLGALVVYQLLVAVQARASVPVDRRHPFFALIDEPRILADLPVPLDTLYETARGLGVGLTIAAQSVTVLPAPVRQSVLTNAATLIAFRQNHGDAELLAPQLPGVAVEALEHLGPFEMLARIGLSPGEVSAPVSGRTLPPPTPSIDPGAVRRRAAERYGADPAAVDKALKQRHSQTAEHAVQAPVGRRRRTP